MKNASLTLFLFALSTLALAHSQNPNTIRKAMRKGFEVFQQSAPSNILKGDLSIHVNGTNAQVFDVKKDGTRLGRVVQIEVGEVIHIVTLDAKNEVNGVFRENSPVPQSDWGSLAFVSEIKNTLEKMKNL